MVVRSMAWIWAVSVMTSAGRTGSTSTTPCSLLLMLSLCMEGG